MVAGSLSLSASNDALNLTHSHDRSKVEDFEKYAQNARAAGQLDIALGYLDTAINKSIEIRDTTAWTRNLITKSEILQLTDSFNQTHDHLLLAMELRKLSRDMPGLAEVNNRLGAMYQTLGDTDKAAGYYGEAQVIYERLGEEKMLGYVYNNLGTMYRDMGLVEPALDYLNRSLEIWTKLEEKGWIPVAYMHLGAVHDIAGNLDSAEYYTARSIELIDQAQVRSFHGLLYGQMGQIQQDLGNLDAGLEWCKKGLEISLARGVQRFEQVNCECLYNIYDIQGNSDKALEFHKRFIALREITISEKKKNSLKLKDLEAEVERKRLEAKARHDEEVREEQKKRNRAIFAGVCILLIAGWLWSRLRLVRRAKSIIQHERDKSENLLLNILPGDIAEELKEKGEAAPRRFDQVTILFTDFKGFTRQSASMSAESVVEEINECFSAFDGICNKYGIEKIKTIGDAYMAAGGLPDKSYGPPGAVVHAALEMQDFVVERYTRKKSLGLTAFQMRCGIHSGAVVAGIVGVNKFQYDIWGDAVNTASRLESSGDVGKVNISGTTYELVKNDNKFDFEFRGKVEAKGKGEIDMYYVSAT